MLEKRKKLDDPRQPLEQVEQVAQEIRAWAQARVAALEAQLAAKDELVREQSEKLTQLQQELDEARRRDEETAQKIELLEREKAEILAVQESINRSLGWRLVKRYRRAKNRLLPLGTLRRRLYDRLLMRLKNSEPLTAFPSTAQHNTRGRGMVIGASTHHSVRAETSQLQVQELPTCSIVIPVFNRAVFTKVCLLAIERSIPPEQLPYEVIVVDNGSTDETPHLLSAWARSRASARVISLGQNLGFAHACNEGARLARGQYIIFLNNDTLPTPGWLEKMLHLAESETRVGIVGSKLLYPDGRIQHIGVVFDQNKSPRHIYRGFASDIPPARISREYQAVTGACLLVGRDLYQGVGGMDEDYQNSYEETDLCLKVRARGYRVLVCADSVIYHFESISEGRGATDFRNSALFKARWENRIECDEDRWYTLDNLRKEWTEFEPDDGYDQQESLLRDLWKRVYLCAFPDWGFGSSSSETGSLND